MLELNEGTLKKLEDLYKAFQYKVRYEKGQFQAGYCLVMSQKVIVINKFYTTDVRINTLLEILSQVEIDESTLELSEAQAAFWEEVKKEITPVETKQGE